MEDLFEDALFPYLSADATLQSLLNYVGKGTGGGTTKFALFDDQAPQDRPSPYVICSISDDQPNYSAAGQCPSSVALVNLDIYGDSKTSVRSVRSRIHELVSGYSSSSDGEMGTLWIDSMRITSLNSRPQSQLFGDEFGTYCVSMGLEVRYRISVPS